jgi:hypothetical protein
MALTWSLKARLMGKRVENHFSPIGINILYFGSGNRDLTFTRWISPNKDLKWLWRKAFFKNKFYKPK